MNDLWAIVGVVLLLFASIFGFILFFIREFLQKPANQAQNDVTNMMILFQTMRDLLSEQKDLARQFNRSIDQKVNEVRALLDGKDEVQNHLLEAKRDIAQLVQNTRRELAVIQRRADAAALQRPVDVPDEGTDSPTVEPEPADEPADNDDSQQVDDSDASPEASADGNGKSSTDGNGVKPLRAVPEEPPVEKRDMIDAWTGVDFGTPESHEEPAQVIEEPAEDVAATRNAMRSLLNVQSPDGDEQPPDPFNAAQESQNNLTPIQMRVYEYADAGMRVPEIARELGVGKGEVRLILSLRKGQRR